MSYLVVIEREVLELITDPEWKTQDPVIRGTVYTDRFVTDHLPRIGETLDLLSSEGGTTLPGKIIDIRTTMGFSRNHGVSAQEARSRQIANSVVTISLAAHTADEGGLETARKTLGHLGLKNWEDA